MRFLLCLFFLLALQARAGQPLTETCAVSFADSAKGKELIGQEDDYVKLQQDLERSVRANKKEAVKLEGYLASARAAVREFSTEEKTRLEESIKFLEKQFKAYKIKLPKEIWLVKTDGSEEGAPYTRVNFIVLPQKVFSRDQRSMRILMAHEIFHILTRKNHKLRDELYKIIGFKKCGVVKLTDDLFAHRLTNPDAPLAEHFITLKDASGRELHAIPYLHVKTKDFASVKPGGIFKVMGFVLLEIEKEGEAWKLKSEKLIDVRSVQKSFFAQIGQNTGYIIHPEEVLADNFAQLMLEQKVRTPRIHKEMAALLKKTERK